MRKIIAMLRPFDMEQTLMVYEDGNKIDMKTTDMNSLTPAVFALVDTYEVKQLDIVGPKKYSEGIRTQIQVAGVTQYSCDDLEINII